jgi:hypothetical protein
MTYAFRLIYREMLEGRLEVIGGRQVIVLDSKYGPRSLPVHNGWISDDYKHCFGLINEYGVWNDGAA